MFKSVLTLIRTKSTGTYSLGNLEARSAVVSTYVRLRGGVLHDEKEKKVLKSEF